MNQRKQLNTARGLCLIAVASLLALNCSLDDDSATPPPVVPPPRPSWTPKAGFLNTPLNELDPVAFYGSEVGYLNEYYTLGPKTIYIDGSLSEEIISDYPYVYNSFVSAAEDFVDGSETEPMRVLIAPWVYWCDDRDDPVTAGTEGKSLFGMEIEKTWLRLEGLTIDPNNVILCGNRGQYNGSQGNWTLFRIQGDGLYVQDLTIANYCSVDLVYPLNHELDYPRRSTANPQAQLVAYSGDKAFARNVNFISRLNLMPINGGTRTLYDNCHFECTDDAINGNAVYLNCDFDFYGGKPAAVLSGSVFLNCDFSVKSSESLNIGKGSSPYGAIIDGRFVSNGSTSIGWTQDPTLTVRCYQYNVTLNGAPIVMNKDYPGVSVVLTDDSPLLKAYKFTYGGETIYNTYNLLRGTDDWDPMGVKEMVVAASSTELDIGALPVRMIASVSPDSLETGTSVTSTTNYTVIGRADALANAGDISWSIFTGQEAYASITSSTDNSAVITPTNNTYKTIPVVVEAVSALGLHAAAVVTVSPGVTSAPSFTAEPSIELLTEQGKLKVNYVLNLPSEDLADQSIISWYRCTDGLGADARLVAVSRNNVPEYEYTLTNGDIGYYIKAEVTPKHIISSVGDEYVKSAYYSSVISASSVKNGGTLTTDFHNIPTDDQSEARVGFWALDSYRPPSMQDGLNFNYTWTPGVPGWRYTAGQDSASEANIGRQALLNSGRGARLRYTPIAGNYGDMTAILVVNPEKSSDQGFGGAGQYLDIGVKFNNETLTGYALRIERVAAFGNGTVMDLVKYENGEITYLTNNRKESDAAHTAWNAAELGSAEKAELLLKRDAYANTCFATACTVEVKVVGSTLSAKVRTTKAQDNAKKALGYQAEVDLNATITPNTEGGFWLNHTGTTSAGNRSLLTNLQIDWN
jgi:hypothetical protein